MESEVAGWVEPDVCLERRDEEGTVVSKTMEMKPGDFGEKHESFHSFVSCNHL